MIETINVNISKIEHKYARFNTLLITIFIFIYLVQSIIFQEKFAILFDITKFIPTLIATLVIRIKSVKYNLNELGNYAVFIFMMTTFIFCLFIAKFYPLVLCEFYNFFLCFLMFYSFKKSLVYASFFFLVLPMSYLFYDLTGFKCPFSENFMYTRSILMFMKVACVSIATLFFLFQLYAHKIVKHFIQENEILIEKIPLIKFDLRTKFNQKESVSSSLLSEMEKLYIKIEEYMQLRKPWLDPDYSIEQLARDLKSNTLYISKAVNIYAKTNFKSYLNEYRIQTFVNEANKNRHDKKLIKEIYLEIGFKSQVTFNRVFKARFDMTPQEYIDNLDTQDLISK